MSLNTGQFWSLKKSYYSEADNSAPYDTYEKFISGAMNDSTISDFVYETPFSFTPSYGSTIAFSFQNNLMEFGDGYAFTSPGLMNNIFMKANLRFSDRTDSEALEIVNYIKNVGTHGFFPYQTVKRNTVSNQDSYKSLYSIPPYFIQEFRCDDISHDIEYTNKNNIDLTLFNYNLSEFTVHSAVDIPSLPTETRTLMQESRASDKFELVPSYGVPIEMGIKNNSFGPQRGRRGYAKEGLNDIKHLFYYMFKSLNNEELLKLLSFMLDKAGSKKFKCDLPPPYTETKEFICTSIEHNYVFKDSHDVKCFFLEIH